MKKLLLSISVLIALTLGSCGGSLESKKQQLKELENKALELSEKALQGEKVNEKELLDLSEQIKNLEEEIEKMEAEQDNDSDYDDDDDD